jgi:Cys-rich protein (TIGR01571 family)
MQPQQFPVAQPFPQGIQLQPVPQAVAVPWNQQGGQQVFYSQVAPPVPAMPMPVVASAPMTPSTTVTGMHDGHWSHSFCQCSGEVCIMSICCGPCRWAQTMQRSGVLGYGKALCLMLVPFLMYCGLSLLQVGVQIEAALEEMDEWTDSEGWTDFTSYSNDNAYGFVDDYADWTWGEYYTDYFTDYTVTEPSEPSEYSSEMNYYYYYYVDGTVSTMPVTNDLPPAMIEGEVDYQAILGMIGMGHFVLGLFMLSLAMWGRQQLRRVYRIQGSCCSDFWTWYCCASCALAQEAMHADTSGSPQGFTIV